MKIKNLTKEEFIAQIGDFESDANGWKYKGTKPCIVDFYAPWCGYCKRLAPLLEELADLYGDRLDIFQVNVDDEESLESAFRIRTIPTLLLCPLEKPWSLTLGVLTKPQLKELIETKVL